MTTHHRGKTFLRKLPPDIVEYYLSSDGTDCPACGGINHEAIENRYGANQIIWRCDECGLDFAMHYALIGVTISDEDVVQVEDALGTGHMILGDMFVERHGPDDTFEEVR